MGQFYTKVIHMTPVGFPFPRESIGEKNVQEEFLRARSERRITGELPHLVVGDLVYVQCQYTAM